MSLPPCGIGISEETDSKLFSRSETSARIGITIDCVTATLIRPTLALLLAALLASPPQEHVPAHRPASASFLGFDTNLYPGDHALDALRKNFTFSGYWLNAPPGVKGSASTWQGKRTIIRSKGFGFLVLFNGRRHSELKTLNNAVSMGKSEGALAAKAARSEGFPPRTIIFLDQEEGGRLLAEQRAYLHAWVDTVTAGGYRAGVYCSGIAHHEPWSGTDVITAQDIRDNAGRRDITYFVSNDQCPPAPGCTLSNPPAPPASGTAFAEVWQFAQSPRRRPFTQSCAASYAANGNCYAPGDTKVLVDLNVATSPDPSRGR